MKKTYLLFFLFISTAIFAQKDSLQIGDRYLEDQLYFGLNYNQLYSQPTLVRASGFSYGIYFGYIKDFPLVKSGRLALGLGLGYAYNSYNQGLKISTISNQVVFEAAPDIDLNRFSTKEIELPFEIRWRTSTANKYKFWRIYTGIKFSYNLNNTFSYQTTTDLLSYTNVSRFNKLQYGLTLSAGYAAFNFNVYYGLTPLLKDANVGTPNINTKVLKLGMIIYIL